MAIDSIDLDDLALWPDGTSCFYGELSEFSWKSDDYEVIPFDTSRWHEINDTSSVQPTSPR